ncbi:MAG: hypothetical protein M1438_16420 [Deltaproteobacteria bacterium]|nr:hypothetical protein [Deltaproteobacteria bacterium]
MGWNLMIPLLVAVLGWFIAHRLAAARDRANKRREVRVSYLIEAFRRLGKGVHGRVFDYAADFESAVLDVQLFGNLAQIESVQKFVQEFANKHEASLDELLSHLRNDLRKELRLPEVEDKLWWLRLEKKM